MSDRALASRKGWLASLALGVLLTSCGPLIPSGQGPTRPAPSRPVAATALAAGVRAGPAIASLGITREDAAAAISSFRESCQRLMTRTDSSRLTRGEDWQPACNAAPSWPVADAPGFFSRFFETVRVGDARAFVTGYFEPQIAGVRRRQPGFDVPIYATPPDLVRARPGDAAPLPDGRQPLGRYDQNGRFVPYYSRAEVQDGVLAGRGLEIGWAADPVEFYFLQVQGSGRLYGPDGSVMRLGYASQNGRPSKLIGGLMRERGLIGDGVGQYSGSMQGIMQYVREHPDEGHALLRRNDAFVFFRELTGDGPVGALGVPVRGRSSAAVDPAYVPLGSPVWLSVDRGEANGLWIAQDTGGAIKGLNRFDTFWGAGLQAREVAGGMSARGQALLLLPKGTLARLGAR